MNDFQEHGYEEFCKRLFLVWSKENLEKIAYGFGGADEKKWAHEELIKRALNEAQIQYIEEVLKEGEENVFDCE